VINKLKIYYGCGSKSADTRLTRGSCWQESTLLQPTLYTTQQIWRPGLRTTRANALLAVWRCCSRGRFCQAAMIEVFRSGQWRSLLRCRKYFFNS